MHKTLNALSKPATLLRVALVLAIVTLLGMSAIEGRGSAKQNAGRQYEFAEVKPADHGALRLWAEDWCRGATVRDLSVALGVDESKSAIANYLSMGLPDDARQIVVKICERELI